MYEIDEASGLGSKVLRCRRARLRRFACPALSVDDSRLYIYIYIYRWVPANLLVPSCSKHRLDIVTRGAWAFTRPHRPHNLNFPVKVSPKLYPQYRRVGGKENRSLGRRWSNWSDDGRCVRVLGFAIRWWVGDEGDVGATG